jgi:hypothetical protein
MYDIITIDRKTGGKEMLKFDENKVVGKVEITKYLTEDDISTIMVNGIETSIGYWAGLNNSTKEWDDKPADEPSSTWATKLLLEGKEVLFYDREDEDREYFPLTLEKLIKGFQMNAEKRPFDAELDQGDAITYDAIIQYALFGEIVYG